MTGRAGADLVALKAPACARAQMTNGTGTNMTLWSAEDPTFLQLATRWWSELLPRVAPFMWAQGGPVVMIQA